jgi:hypothetical protein
MTYNWLRGAAAFGLIMLVLFLGLYVAFTSFSGISGPGNCPQSQISSPLRDADGLKAWNFEDIQKLEEFVGWQIVAGSGKPDDIVAHVATPTSVRVWEYVGNQLIEADPKVFYKATASNFPSPDLPDHVYEFAFNYVEPNQVCVDIRTIL